MSRPTTITHAIRVIIAIFIALVLLAVVVDVVDATAAEATTEHPPYADHCLIGGDETQIVSPGGITICVHTEGDGLRIL